MAIRVVLLLLAAALRVPVAVAQPAFLAIPNPTPLPQQSYFAEFGRAVAALGDDILVGDANASTVYLFDGATGALLRTFTGSADSRFGTSVAVLGANVLVGAPDDDAGGTDRGAAYLYDGSTGALLRTFLDPTPQTFAEFGHAVAAVGANVLVGTPGDEAAYLFDAAAGALLQTFVNPGIPGLFGVALAAIGGNVAIGAPYAGSGGVSFGDVYVFDAATGALVHTIPNPNPPATQGFGVALAAFGADILVGAAISCCASDQGAFLFDGATAALLQTFPVDGNGAHAVGALGGNVLVGASGTASIFDPLTAAPLRVFDDPTHTGSTFFTPAVVALGNKVVLGFQGEPFHDRYGVVYSFCGGITECGPCETCDATGACVAAPHPTCRVPLSGRSTLVFKDKSPDDRDRLLWKVAGAFPDPARENAGTIFGNPAVAGFEDDYALCLWDESGPTPSLLFRADAPAAGTCAGRDCWRALTTSAEGNTLGYLYVDGEETPHGLDNMLVRTQVSGGARMKVRGKGGNLSTAPVGMPAPPLNLPLRVQLQVRNGYCWESTYSSARANEQGLFRATAVTP